MVPLRYIRSESFDRLHHTVMNAISVPAGICDPCYSPQGEAYDRLTIFPKIRSNPLIHCQNRHHQRLFQVNPILSDQMPNGTNTLYQDNSSVPS